MKLTNGIFYNCRMVLLLFFVVANFVTISFASQYENEFNDNKDNALKIDAFGSQVIGNLWHAFDYDWYSFDIQEGKTIKISAIYNSGQSDTTIQDALFIEIRDSSNHILSGFPVSFGQSDQHYQGSVSIGSAGTYYLVVYCPAKANHHKEQYKIALYDASTLDPSAGETLSDAQFLSLALSQLSVKSDNSDSSQLTITVLDGYHVPVEGAKVAVNVDAGQISNAFPETDAEGKAVIVFSSGNLDKKNQLVDIKVSVLGTDPVLTKTIPIVITGTTLLVDPGSITNLEIGGNDTTTLTILAKDAGEHPISDAAISVTRDDSSSIGFVENIPFEGTTDYLGKAEVNIKAFAQGNLVLKIEGLGTTVTQNYSVYSTGDALHIIEPDQNNISLAIYDQGSLKKNENYASIKVSVPDTLVKNSHTIRFISTLGKFSKTSSPSSSYTHPLDVNAQKEINVYFKSDEAGVASIYAYDTQSIIQNDSLSATISAPAKDATQISLQADPIIVPPSTNDIKNISDLVVTVKDKDDQIVGGATVIFRIPSPTGGGETVSPVWTTTDSSGVARATFTSGSLSSGGEGVSITAEVLDADQKNINDSVEVVIGGTPGSIVIGRSTDILSDDTNTYYKLPMSVLVADAGGHPVALQDVSLNSWPKQYHTGAWVETEDGMQVIITGSFDNEDAKNKNLILDVGEDKNGDGMLTPPNTASGNVPGTVTTDENGVASFELIYLKEYAVWITSEITASTIVHGTETKSVLEIQLPYKIGEEKSLPDSPFGP